MDALLEFELHGLNIWFLLLILIAGIWAGTINTVVGSGTLVTFPVLVSMGVPPVSATVSNAMGLIAGNFTGAWGYRREIRSAKSVLKRVVPASILGGVIGAILLISLPPSVFETVAPVLLVVSLGFVIAQPRLAAWVRRRAQLRESGAGSAEATAAAETPAGETVETPAAEATAGPPAEAAATPAPVAPRASWALVVFVFLAGIYGGYFVAAQGILLLALFGVFMTASIQQANGVKNLLVAFVNLTAAISYVVVDYLFREPDERVILWGVVAIIAVGSTVGGLLGAWIGRRLSPPVLRAVIIILGLVALFVMLRNLFIG